MTVLLKWLQHDAKALSAKKGWDAQSTDRRITHLTSEIGEVAKAFMLLNYGSDSPEGVEKLRKDLGDEIADVIWNLADLANRTGIDLTVAYTRKNADSWAREWGSSNDS